MDSNYESSTVLLLTIPLPKVVDVLLFTLSELYVGRVANPYFGKWIGTICCYYVLVITEINFYSHGFYISHWTALLYESTELQSPLLTVLIRANLLARSYISWEYYRGGLIDRKTLRFFSNKTWKSLLKTLNSTAKLQVEMKASRYQRLTVATCGKIQTFINLNFPCRLDVFSWNYLPCLHVNILTGCVRLALSVALLADESNAAFMFLATATVTLQSAVMLNAALRNFPRVCSTMDGTWPLRTIKKHVVHTCDNLLWYSIIASTFFRLV